MHDLARQSVTVVLAASLAAGSVCAASPVGPFPLPNANAQTPTDEVLGPPMPAVSSAENASRAAVSRSEESGLTHPAQYLRSDATISLAALGGGRHTARGVARGTVRGVGGSRGADDAVRSGRAPEPAAGNSAKPSVTAAAEPAQPAEPSGFAALLTGWDGKVELGLNGSTGNSDAASLRLRVSGARKEGRHETKASLTYRTATRGGETTQNRLDIESRHDWRSADNGRWRAFGNARSEWDEFQDYDLRLSGFIGLGYDLIREDDLSIVGRAGLGGRLDVGGRNDGFRPEGIFGLDSNYKISERQRVTAKAEAVPDFESSDYRLETEAAWEVVIDPDNNLSLRIGGEIRYDSGASPGFDETDASYFMTLGWSF